MKLKKKPPPSAITQPTTAKAVNKAGSARAPCLGKVQNTKTGTSLVLSFTEQKHLANFFVDLIKINKRVYEKKGKKRREAKCKLNKKGPCIKGPFFKKSMIIPLDYFPILTFY